MKALLILISISMYSNVILSQVSGVFSLSEVEKNIDCNIYLYHNGVYEILIEEQETDDILLKVLVSYGNYTLSNGNITLSDNYNGYKMVFGYQDDFIVAKKIFKWLVNRKFIKSDFQIWDKPGFTKNKIRSLNHDRLNFKQVHKDVYPLDFGVYESKQGFRLNIQQNNKYKFEYKGISLSEGVWNRKENELVLLDATLKYSFYVLIDEKVLISKFLPGDYKGYLLFKQ